MPDEITAISLVALGTSLHRPELQPTAELVQFSMNIVRASTGQTRSHPRQPRNRTVFALESKPPQCDSPRIDRAMAQPNFRILGFFCRRLRWLLLGTSGGHGSEVYGRAGVQSHAAKYQCHYWLLQLNRMQPNCQASARRILQQTHPLAMSLEATLSMPCSEDAMRLPYLVLWWWVLRWWRCCGGGGGVVVVEIMWRCFVVVVVEVLWWCGGVVMVWCGGVAVWRCGGVVWWFGGVVW